MKIGGHGMDDGFCYGASRWAHLPLSWARLFTFAHTVDPEAALIADRDGGVLLTCDSVQHWLDLEGCSPLAKGVALAMGFKRPANIGPPWRRRMTPPGGSLKPD